MPGKSSLDKALAKIEKDHGKIIELLQRELESERTQSEAARKGADEAREALAELDGKRPDLASEVFGGKAEYSALDELDSEISRLRRHLEIAEIAEERSAARMPEIEQRMQEAKREAAGKRYDALAAERREHAVALDAVLDTVVEHADALLAVDQRQRVEEELGIQPLGVTYAEVLDLHLGCRLRRHMRAAALASNNIDFNQQRASLVEKDYKTRSLGDVHSENAAEMDRVGREREQREISDQARARKEKYDQRRLAIHAMYGYTKDVTMGAARRTKVDQIVDATLSREFPELFAQEQRTAMGRRRTELRGLLGYSTTDEDLSDDERCQLEERIDEQLREEFPSASLVEVVAG